MTDRAEAYGAFLDAFTPNDGSGPLSREMALREGANLIKALVDGTSSKDTVLRAEEIRAIGGMVGSYILSLAEPESQRKW